MSALPLLMSLWLVEPAFEPDWSTTESAKPAIQRPAFASPSAPPPASEPPGATAAAAPAPTTSPPTTSPTASPAATVDAPTPRPAWSQVFSVATVKSHLQGENVRVVVVPAGTHPQAEPAAVALVGVLRASPEAALVKRAAAVSIDSDMQIARRVSLKGFDRVFVVRSFDVDGRVQAVITVLDAYGETLDAFVAWSDQVLEVTDTTSLGVSERTMRVITDESEAHGSSASSSGPEPIVYVPHRGAFYRGYVSGSRELDDDEFYEYVGRHDLARQHRARSKGGWTLFSVGMAATGTGAIIAVAASLFENTRLRRGSLAVAGGGLVVAGSGLALALSKPAARSERIEMAEAYNRQLEARNRNEDDDEDRDEDDDRGGDRDRDRTGRSSLSLRPAVGFGHAGIVLEGRF
ncbi:MAG: hypothetical protein AAGF11_13940 [Myxococcota bacterium]